MANDASLIETQPGIFSRSYKRYCQIHQKILDSWTPYSAGRWFSSFILVVLYVMRVVWLQGCFVISYVLGIYALNLLATFLSPKIDPELLGDLDDDGPKLPTNANEEFRPFIRQLPEFKFWYSITKALLIGMVCTYFEIFNVPVFWPILVIYFIILFCLTMKKQIRHMIKYRYLPFTYGKTRYKGKSNTN